MTRRRVRRVAGAAVVLVLLVVLVMLATSVSLTRQLGRIEGAFEGLDDRPAEAPGETIMLVGTRPGGGTDVPWLPGEQSAESVMLVEIDADHREVEVKTLPDDVAVESSVAAPAPSAAVAAVEEWSGRRVDHLMSIDWRTFAELAADNEVDHSYRYGSSAAVQHDYMRDVLKGTLRVELRKEPLSLYRQLSTTAAGLAIDDDWSIGELDWLLLSLRNLRSNDIDFSSAEPG